MTDVIDVTAKSEHLKTVGWVSYLLHLIVALAAVVPGANVGVVLLVVALVIDLVKKSEAEGTWQESHFSWRIRSTVWVAIWYTITFPLFLLLWVPGAIAWLIISVWFLYRIVRGMVAMNQDKAVSA